MGATNLKSWVMLMVLFTVGMVSALPIYVSPLSGEELQPGVTFSYVFNFTTGSDCSGVLLTNSSSITMKANGVGFIDIDISSLSSKPNFLCEYRDGSLRKVHNFSDMILEDVWVESLDVGSDVNVAGSGFFGFLGSLANRISKIWASEIDVSGNVTAAYFFGDGAGLTNLNLSGLEGASQWTTSGNDIYYDSGNVGIGTASPSTKLEVAGSINFTSGLLIFPDGTSMSSAVSADGTYVPYTGADSNVVLGNNDFSVGGSDFFVDNVAGNVGIGTSSPLSALNIVSSQTSPIVLSKTGSTGISFSSYWPTLALNMYHDGTEWVAIGSGYVGQWNQQPNTGTMTFGISSASRTAGAGLGSGPTQDLIVIEKGGAIGMGDSSPDGTLRLDVEGQIGATQYCDETGANCIDIANVGTVIGSGVNGRVAFWDDVDTVSSNSGFVWDDINKRLGIGTSSPGEKLEVNGSINVTSGNDVCIEGGNCLSTIGSGTIGGSGTSNYIPKFTAGTTIGNSLIYDDGTNVGIGTSSPGSKLQINGDIKLSDGGDIGWISNIRPIVNGGSLRLENFAGTELMVLQTGGNVGIGTSSPTSKLDVNGSASIGGVLVMNSNKITGMANGTAAQDGVTKSQLDAVSVGAGTYLELNGGTMNGTLDMGNNAITNIDWANSDDGAGSGLDADKVDGYEASYFMPLNTSVTGDFDFNGGWAAGGLSIINGDLYAQTAFLYNITSLGVNTLSINGSIIPPAGFDNQFDIGSASLRWRDLYLGGEVRADGTGDSYVMGNFGIGTTSPAYKLEVYEPVGANAEMGITAVGGYDSVLTLHADEAAGAQSIIRFSDIAASNAGEIAYTHNSGGTDFMTFRTAAIERMRIDSNGNVGIGATDPLGYRLNIEAGASGSGLRIKAGSTSSQYQIRSLDSAGNVDFVVRGDGNVGIGTASPNEKLEITSSGYGGAYISLASVGRSGVGYPAIGDNLDFTGTSSVYNYRRSDTASMIEFRTGDIRFFTAPSGTVGNTIGFTEVMRIDQGLGNVGIGTASPTASLMLDVEGKIGATQYCDEAGANCIDIADVVSGTNYVLKAGDTMSGTLNMGNNAITNINWATSDDGAGSGLDADLLDGVNGADFTREDLTMLGKTGSVSLDGVTNTAAEWSNLPVGYSRMISSGVGTAGGAPVDNHGYFTKVANRDTAGGWGGLWAGYSSGENYIGRTSTSSTFATWDKLWSDANDGSGSGLDADLWDGNQFASYINQAVLSTSSPTFAGLTLNGDLELTDDDLENTGTVYHDDTTRYLSRISSTGTDGGTLFDIGSYWDTSSNYLRYRGWTGVALDVQTTNVLTSTTSAMTIVPPLTVPTINTGSGAKELGDAAVANGDTNSIPTGDQVYDFVVGLGYTNDQTAAEILTAIKTVDGSGSGLDADLLDGVSSAGFVAVAGDTMTGTLTVGDATSDYSIAYGGFKGHPSANIGGTGDAAYMPEGIFSQKYNWLYGGINMGNGDLLSVGSITSSGTVKSTGGVIHEDNSAMGYISHPKGGYYRTTSDSITGAIRICLPTYGPSDMLGFKVDIFDYSLGESVTVNIFGYAYQATGNTWTNEAVTIETGRSDRDYNVRFGTQSSKQCVWIGETTSTWAYPQVTVRDFFGGYNTDIDAYDDGWTVSFQTSLGTIDSTISANYIYSDWNKMKNIPTNVAGINQALTTTSAVTFATINTGQGANDLYDMNQNVLTSSNPTFNNLYIASGNDDGIKFWGGDSSYTITMGNDQADHGTVTDYSMHFNMGTTAGRGFTFGSADTVVKASINALTGDIYSSGKVRGDGGLYVGDDEYFWRDAEDRIATMDTFYVQATSPNTYLYSTNTYLGNTAGDNILVRGNTISGTSWSITGAGTVTAASFLYNSDERLKENIKRIDSESALSKIMRLEGVTFEWKNFNDTVKENEDPTNISNEAKIGIDINGTQIGLIAQDVQKIFPELVQEDANGYLTVQYSNLIAPLIEAVKEQQSQIEEQNDLIESLRERLEVLEAKIALLGR